MNQPNQFPQQPWQPAPAAPQQPQQAWQPPAGAPIHAAAASNLFTSYLQQPAKQVIVREKPEDGTHVVVLLNTTVVKQSQQDGGYFLLVQYEVLESNVAKMVGRQFATPMGWKLKFQQEAVADLAKALFGAAGIQQMIQRGITSPESVANTVAAAVQAQPYYVLLHLKRNTKQMNDGVPYDECFVNHTFIMAHTQRGSLQQFVQAAQAQGIPVPMSAPAPHVPHAPAQAAPPAFVPPSNPNAQAVFVPANPQPPQAVFIPSAQPQAQPQQPPQQAWPQAQPQQPAQAWPQAQPQAQPQQPGVPAFPPPAFPPR